MESPPPLCGGVADTERVGADRTIAANVVAIAMSRFLGDWIACFLLPDWSGAETNSLCRQEFTQMLCGDKGIEIRFASFKIRH
jgi:hypothetical protein